MCRTINKAICFSVLVAIMASCNDDTKWLPQSPQKTIIALQPFSAVDTGLL
jgi:hypothetical protein